MSEARNFNWFLGAVFSEGKDNEQLVQVHSHLVWNVSDCRLSFVYQDDKVTHVLDYVLLVGKSINSIEEEALLKLDKEGKPRQQEWMIGSFSCYLMGSQFEQWVSRLLGLGQLVLTQRLSELEFYDRVGEREVAMFALGEKRDKSFSSLKSQFFRECSRVVNSHTIFRYLFAKVDFDKSVRFDLVDYRNRVVPLEDAVAFRYVVDRGGTDQHTTLVYGMVSLRNANGVLQSVNLAFTTMLADIHCHYYVEGGADDVSVTPFIPFTYDELSRAVAQVLGQISQVGMTFLFKTIDKVEVTPFQMYTSLRGLSFWRQVQAVMRSTKQLFMSLVDGMLFSSKCICKGQYWSSINGSFLNVLCPVTEYTRCLMSSGIVEMERERATPLLPSTVCYLVS